MITYQKLHKQYKALEEKVKRHFYSVTCDVCNTKYQDVMEVQEFLHVNFTGSYGSVFGDMAKVECNICQHCLFEMIGRHAVITPETYEEFETVDAFLDSLD